MSEQPEAPTPQIIIERDFDGYFEDRVRQILASPSGSPSGSPYRIVRIRATPFLPDAVQYRVTGDEILILFYAALRSGFGEIDWAMVSDLLHGEFPGVR